MPASPLLTISDLRLSFSGLRVLTGVELEVHPHEVVGLIGPNGAGKTTVFNCLSGLLTPDGGRIEYRGIDVLALAPHDRPALGIARTFQQVGLCGAQTASENLLIAQHRLATGRYAQRRAVLTERGRSALDLLGLGDIGGYPVADLPHGRQRLVEVAAAIATGPELLLLDEPAAGLSPEEAMDLAERLRMLRRSLDLSMLIIEHHLPVITSLCDYVYVLESGAVLARGTPESVQREPAVVAAYLGTAKEHADVG